MTMMERTWQAADYRYGFQGQETDDEIFGEGNAVNYTFRMYDARIGRFLSIDRFAAKFSHQSPYIFAGNNPLNGIEIDGDSLYVLNSSGQVRNIVSLDGKAYADQFGYSTLMRTGSGRELLNKYVNSSTHDVYITIGELSESESGTGAITTSIELYPNENGELDINDEALGDLIPFSGLNLRSSENSYSLMLFNEDYINSEGIFGGYDIYDKAESFFHELKSHVDLSKESVQTFNKKSFGYSLFSVEGNRSLGIIQHFMYGVNSSNNLGLQGHNVINGSPAATVREELLQLRQLRNYLQDLQDKIITVTDNPEYDSKRPYGE